MPFVGTADGINCETMGGRYENLCVVGDDSQSIYSFRGANIDNILKIYRKTLILNKLILKETGKDLMFSYKRASSIIFNEVKNNKLELIGTADPGLFKNDFEKLLYKKIHQLRKEFSNIGREDDYEGILKDLSSAKKEVNDFFENVIVNDKDILIKKNRLELLQMLCKTFDNYLNFSKIESL